MSIFVSVQYVLRPLRIWTKLDTTYSRKFSLLTVFSVNASKNVLSRKPSPLGVCFKHAKSAPSTLYTLLLCTLTYCI